MKLWDEVELVENIPSLTAKGILKGYGGTVVEEFGDVCLVWFSNPKNIGEFAFAYVNEKALKIKFNKIFSDSTIEEMKEMMSAIDVTKKDSLMVIQVEEYDKVELIVDKPEYREEGVYKGMQGCVMQPYAVDGKIAILFDNAGENLDESVEILVSLKDFKLVE